MKKTLSILIAVAMLASSAAYAAQKEGHIENGYEKPIRSEQKAENNEVRPNKSEVKPEKEPSDKANNSDNSEVSDSENTNNEVSDSTDIISENNNSGDTDTKDKDETVKGPKEKPKKSENSENVNKSNDEFRKELDEIKKIRREHKAEASKIINDLRDIFHRAPKEDRKEILGEIAQIKKELKDYSIGMFMRGKHIDFGKYDGVKPKIVKDRTLVPLRAVSEALGAEVEWNDEDKTVTVTYNDNTIIVTLDSKTALVNGEETEIKSPALIKKDRVLVPIRVIAEALGLTVEWDEDSHSVIVDEKEPEETAAPMETTEPTETPAPTESAKTNVPTETITE